MPNKPRKQANKAEGTTAGAGVNKRSNQDGSGHAEVHKDKRLYAEVDKTKERRNKDKKNGRKADFKQEQGKTLPANFKGLWTFSHIFKEFIRQWDKPSGNFYLSS